MATQTSTIAGPNYIETTTIKVSSPTYQAYQILRWAFVALPLIAGVDKFFMRLADWDKYVWPRLANLAGGAHHFMQIAGVIEIVAAALVAIKPKLGAPIVAIWLWAIIANLLLLNNYHDVALRDLVLSLAAIALSRLACQFENKTPRTTKL